MPGLTTLNKQRSQRHRSAIDKWESKSVEADKRVHALIGNPPRSLAATLSRRLCQAQKLYFESRLNWLIGKKIEVIALAGLLGIWVTLTGYLLVLLTLAIV